MDQLRFSRNLAVLDDEGAIAIRVVAALGHDNAVVVRAGLSGDEPAVLKEGEGVAEEGVDGAGDGAISVELAV